MKLQTIGLVRAALVAGSGALALAIATAAYGLSPSVAVCLAACLLLAIFPLSHVLTPGFNARHRYQRYHRPLAGPRPGARLG